MKNRLTLLAFVVIGLSCVSMISAKKRTVRLVKENPTMGVRYAITTQKMGKDQQLDKESPRRYKTFKGSEITISFDAYRNAKLYIQKLDQTSDVQPKSLSLRNPTPGLDPEDIIVINEAGVPAYRNKDSFKGFQEALQTTAH